MPESLFKKKTEEEARRDEGGKPLKEEERVIEAKKPDLEPDLCGLIKAYLVVRDIAPEAAEILRQEIIKRL